MISLSKVFMKRKGSVINMFFHSTSLKAGLRSFVETSVDERKFLDQLNLFFAFVREAGIGCMKLSKAAKCL